jgi:hypothetical protein
MKRGPWLLVIAFLLACPAVRAQLNCAPGGKQATSLACLIVRGASPTGYTAASAGIAASSPTASALPELQSVDSTFSFLNTAVGGEISEIPLASPASALTFTIDKATGLQQVADDSLGPVLSQRAQTVGRHRLFIAATYQYFPLEDVDGNSLRGGKLPIALPLYSVGMPANPNTPGGVSIGSATIDLKVHQWVGYATFGLTDRIDVSLAVPVLQVDERYTSITDFHAATAIPPGNVVSPPPQGPNSSLVTNCVTSVETCGTLAQQATGVGDVILAAKGIVKRIGTGGIAIGAEVRLPTGDATNLLGSGTVGVKPFVSISEGNKIAGTLVSYRANLGYQINGKSILGFSNSFENGSFLKGQLPDRLEYSGGTDVRLSSRFTIAADVLAQYVINSPRAFIDQTTVDASGFFCDTSNPLTCPGGNTFNKHLTTAIGSYNRADGSIGIKVRPFRGLVATGNLVVKLDQGGFRARLVPLVGLSYTF